MSPEVSRCHDCRRELVAQREWRAMDSDQRGFHLASGRASRASRGLCQGCDSTRRHRGTIDDLPRAYRTNAEVVEEWNALHDPGAPMNRNIRAVAPRIGMTTQALARALARAGITKEK